MSKFNLLPQSPYRKVAKQIDRILHNETNEAYFTLKPLNESQEKKFNQVTDQMYGILSQEWLQTANIKSHEDRLMTVRGRADMVLRATASPVASSMCNRATDKSLDILLHRERHGIPLHAPMVSNYAPAAALSAPPSDAGNALGRSPSFAGSTNFVQEPMGQPQPPPFQPGRPGYAMA